MSKPPSRPHCRLPRYQCMQTLTSPETVVAYSRAATRDAGDYTETEQHKTTRLWSAPPVLVLVLKRFKVSRPRRSRVGRG